MSQFELLLGLLTGCSINDKQRELMAETSSKDLKILLSKFKSEGKENVITKSRRLGLAFSKIIRGNLFNPNKAKCERCEPEEITLKFEPYKIKKFSLWKYYTLMGNKRSRISSKTEIPEVVISKSDVNYVDQLLVKSSQKNTTYQSETSCFDNGTENINEKRENSEEKNTSNELFFKSVIEGMKELDDEEVLELQIKILKALKMIQAKRKLKQDFKKYCEATAYL